MYETFSTSLPVSIIPYSYTYTNCLLKFIRITEYFSQLLEMFGKFFLVFFLVPNNFPFQMFTEYETNHFTPSLKQPRSGTIPMIKLVLCLALQKITGTDAAAGAQFGRKHV